MQRKREDCYLLLPPDYSSLSISQFRSIFLGFLLALSSSPIDPFLTHLVFRVEMEISALVDSISLFLNLSSSRHIDLDPFDKYYNRVEKLLGVLKPIADAAVLNSDLALEEKLCKSFQELIQDVDHSRDLFTSWHPFSSKVYFVSSHNFSSQVILKLMESETMYQYSALYKTLQRHLTSCLMLLAYASDVFRIKLLTITLVTNIVIYRVVDGLLLISTSRSSKLNL